MLRTEGCKRAIAVVARRAPKRFAAAIVVVALAGGAVASAAMGEVSKVARVHQLGPPPVFEGAVVLEGELPPRARQAYEAAAGRFSSFGCRGDWAVLAAVAQVESGHGRAGEDVAFVTADGQVLPPVRGRILDGTGGVAAVVDTDGGLLDGDADWDRAVGPLQFLPTTWQEVGLDASGDGLADPDNLDDAALTAAAYLCHRAPGADLADEAVLAEALLGYNNSPEYARKVLDLVDHHRGRGIGNRVALGEIVPLGVDPRSLRFPVASAPAESLPPEGSSG